MRIDYIYPHSENDWEASAWIRGLKRRGVLNKAIGMKPGGEGQLFSYLKNTRADVVFFCAADHHMSYLLNDERKRNFLRSLSPLTVHFSGEPVLNSSIPWSMTQSQNALSTFDKFLFSYEGDVPFFFPLIKEGRASLSMFAIDETIWFPEAPYEERISRVFLSGKITDFGIKDSRIYKIIEELLQSLVKNNSIDAIYDPSATTDQVRASFSSRCAMINLPGLGGVSDGYSRKAMECLACGTLLLQPRQSEGSVSSKIFSDGFHLIGFDVEKPYILEGIIREIEGNPVAFAEISANGYSEVIKNHTIDRRIDGIIAFLIKNSPVHEGFDLVLKNQYDGIKLGEAHSIGFPKDFLQKEIMEIQEIEGQESRLLKTDASLTLLLRRLKTVIGGASGGRPVRFTNFLTRPVDYKEWSKSNNYSVVFSYLSKEFSGEKEDTEYKGYWNTARELVMQAYRSPCAVVHSKESLLFLWKWQTGEELFIAFGRDRTMLLPDPYWLKFYPFLHGPDQNGYYIANIQKFNWRTVSGKHFYIGGNDNWTHWLVDALANYQFIEECDDLQDCTIVTGKLKDWQHDTMKMLGVTQNIMEIDAGDQQEAIIFSDLFVPIGRPLHDRYVYLRDKMGFNRESIRRRGVYLTRKNLAPRHRVSNEDSIQKYLRDMGYDIVVPEELGLEEKRKIIWESDVVIVPPGSGCTNFFLFSRPDAVLVQMLPGYYKNSGIPENWVRGAATYFVPFLDRCVFTYSREVDHSKSFDEALEYPIEDFASDLSRAESMQSGM